MAKVVRITPTEDKIVDGLGVFYKDEPKEFDEAELEGFVRVMGVPLDGYLPEKWKVERAGKEKQEGGK